MIPRRFAAVALLLASFIVPLSAANAAPSALGQQARAKAEGALAKVKQLQRGKAVITGRELTPALNALYEALPSLRGDDRAEAKAVLARPDDDAADPDGMRKWSNEARATAARECTAHFCVHWVRVSDDAPSSADGDIDGVPDYVEQMLSVFEDEVFPCENGSSPDACAGRPGLGWRGAEPDGPRGGDERTDVYLQDLFANGRLFGYVALDPDQPRDPAVPHSAYVVMDKDYTRFGDGSPAAGLAAERVTAAHEYNHVLQNAYDYLQDQWVFEATAVYMEDKVYPGINDYINYVADWVANPRRPLTAFSDSNLTAYGSAVWNHWLEHRYGPGISKSTWEHSLGAGDFGPSAYGAAIAASGGAGFADEFSRFAAAVTEWRMPGSGFPDPYPEYPRDGTLPTESVTVPFALPHTAFAMFDVPIPASNPPLIRLTVRIPAGTASGLALVGRVGDEAGGSVTANVGTMPSGGVAAVQLETPTQYTRITAVVVNADPSQSGFDSQTGDYIFTRDVGDATAAMTEPGAPIVTTGAASEIADHSAVVSAAVDPHLVDASASFEYGRTAKYGQRSAPQRVPAAAVGSATVATKLTDLKAATTYHFRIGASNGVGRVAAQDVTFRTARDVTKPRLRLKVARQQRARVVWRRGIIVRAGCSERCVGSVRVELSGRAARRVDLPRLLAKAPIRHDGRSATRHVRLRLTARALRRWRITPKGLRAKLRLSASDHAKNRARATRTLIVTGQ